MDGQHPFGWAFRRDTAVPPSGVWGAPELHAYFIIRSDVGESTAEGREGLKRLPWHEAREGCNLARFREVHIQVDGM